MIYKINGDPLFKIYDKDGEITNEAYDKDGILVFSGDITIKVMSYNVGGWYTGSGSNVPIDKYDQYLALQTGMITDNDPAILLVQEYLANFSTGHSALTILQDMFPYVHTQTSGTYFGRAICSKYPISDYTIHTYTNNSSRYYDSCTITIDGRPVTFVNTHLDTDNTKRFDQITQLITYLESLSIFIAGGDFNMLDCKTITGEDYIEIIEPILDAGFHSANCTDFGFLETYSDQPDGTWTGCLDNIITSSNITINTASVDTTKLTDGLADKVDHMPLIATLTI